MTLDVAVRRQAGTFRLDAAFSAGLGVTALFGRSGSGKTTLVDLIAGLKRPDAGRIVVDGVTLVDTTKRVFVPPHKRALGYVFQEARLFPHLSVRHNLLYGSWFTRNGRPQANFDRVVDLLGLDLLLGRDPASLSGGEKQRVAIGRALLASPRVLLMDEPLASLDDERKEEILPYIERLRDKSQLPIVYVTHSVGEVRRLATTVIVLSEGRVAAVGSPADVLGAA